MNQNFTASTTAPNIGSTETGAIEETEYYHSSELESEGNSVSNTAKVDDPGGKVFLQQRSSKQEFLSLNVHRLIDQSQLLIHGSHHTANAVNTPAWREARAGYSEEELQCRVLTPGKAMDGMISKNVRECLLAVDNFVDTVGTKGRQLVELMAAYLSGEDIDPKSFVEVNARIKSLESRLLQSSFLPNRRFDRRVVDNLYVLRRLGNLASHACQFQTDHQPQVVQHLVELIDDIFGEPSAEIVAAVRASNHHHQQERSREKIVSEIGMPLSDDFDDIIIYMFKHFKIPENARDILRDEGFNFLDEFKGATVDKLEEIGLKNRIARRLVEKALPWARNYGELPNADAGVASRTAVFEPQQQLTVEPRNVPAVHSRPFKYELSAPDAEYPCDSSSSQSCSFAKSGEFQSDIKPIESSVIRDDSHLLSATAPSFQETTSDSRIQNTEGLPPVPAFRKSKDLSYHSLSVNSVAFNPCHSVDSRFPLLAAGSSDRTISLWDANGQVVKTLSHHTNEVKCVSWHDNAPLLASASSDRTIRVWNAEIDQYCNCSPDNIIGPKLWYNTVAWSHQPNASVLASGSSDRAVRLWRYTGTSAGSSLTCVNTMKGHGHVVFSVDWCPANHTNWIASGSWDNNVIIWDSETGSCLRYIHHQGHTHYVEDVAWNPDGSRLASASADTTVKLWDSREWRCIRTIRGHNNIVNAVCWSPCGRFLATGGADRTVRVWDTLSTSEAPIILNGHGHTVHHVTFDPNQQSADEMRIASSSNDKTVKIWEPTMEEFPYA